MKDALLIYNAHLVDKTRDSDKGAVLIESGKISSFPKSEDVSAMLKEGTVQCFNAEGKVLMPSFIDMHAHFRDPGLTHKEDIASGSRAAAAGGFGTVVLMPNTNPVISSDKAAKENCRKAKELGLSNIIQSVSITKGFDGKTIAHLENLTANEVPLITEDGKEVANSAVMLSAMKIAAKKGIIVSCHCEDPALAEEARPFRAQALSVLQNSDLSDSEKKSKATILLSQANTLLELAEDCATSRNIRLAREAACHLHLCHVSTAFCIQEALRAQAYGAKVTFEITPHHITLAGQKEPNIFHIVNPPLRSEENRRALIEALKSHWQDGICTIATDHAPHTMEEKALGAPGFSGLETAFCACYTTLCKENGLSLSALSALMAANPAMQLGLKNRGLLQKGYYADLVLVDTEKSITVRGSDFKSKGKYTPLEGRTLSGKIEATFLEGRRVF